MDPQPGDHLICFLFLIKAAIPLPAWCWGKPWCQPKPFCRYWSCSRITFCQSQSRRDAGPGKSWIWQHGECSRAGNPARAPWHRADFIYLASHITKMHSRNGKPSRASLPPASHRPAGHLDGCLKLCLNPSLERAPSHAPMLLSAGRKVNTHLILFDELAPKANKIYFAEFMLGLLII